MAGNSKNVLPPFQCQLNGDMAAASTTSVATNIQYLDDISIQLNFTGGSFSGQFNVQGSLDYKQVSGVNGEVTNPGNWVNINIPASAISPSGATLAVSSSGIILINLAGENAAAYPWIRIVYTKTSGNGVWNGFISGKSI